MVVTVGSTGRPKGHKDAIIAVLEREGRPLHYTDITKIATENGWLQTTSKTPSIVVAMRIHQDIEKGDKCPFYKISPGVFGLKKWQEQGLPQQAQMHSIATQDDTLSLTVGTGTDPMHQIPQPQIALQSTPQHHLHQHQHQHHHPHLHDGAPPTLSPAGVPLHQQQLQQQQQLQLQHQQHQQQLALTPGTMMGSMSDTSPSPYASRERKRKKRVNFSPEEDKKLMEFVQNRTNTSLCNRTLWQEAAQMQLTKHSRTAMMNRARTLMGQKVDQDMQTDDTDLFQDNFTSPVTVQQPADQLLLEAPRNTQDDQVEETQIGTSTNDLDVPQVGMGLGHGIAVSVGGPDAWDPPSAHDGIGLDGN
mmetsp:Transcript_13328/g.21859  ORF Transcript_13328/g.21859 Transcript_13328/m.21859 type:complete len:361 (-) Transcript_13328:1564-2646(-)